jgi:glycosidase
MLRLLTLCAALAALAALPCAAAPVDLTPVPAQASPSALQAGWEHGAFMEIFVRAYQDSNGDGIGDLRGLTQHLDYLQELGVKGLWLMPITASSDHDHGYATLDYRSIEPAYGTLEDFDALIKAAHARGIGVIIDYVLNHGSLESPLFQSALKGPDSPYRDWYVWQDQAPLGWEIWGHNPWTATPTGSYYGTFGGQMPDFNLRNPVTVEYHFSSLRFWLNRGLDGFRLDAVPHLIENGAKEWNDQPESRALTHQVQELIKSYPQRHVVCEATADPIAYGKPEVCGSSFAFGLQYEVIKAARGQAEAVQKISEYFVKAPLSMATMLTNHDLFAGQRVWDQLQGNEARMKLAAATYLLMPGTPFIYYGEEIGQAGVLNSEGDGPIRSPMSWGPQGQGFSAGQPFRPLSPNGATHNPDVERNKPASMLNFYKAMLKLRNTRASIAQGSYEAPKAKGQVLSFRRRLGQELSIVLINYGDKAVDVSIDGLPRQANLRSLYPSAGTAHKRVKLAPLSVQVLSADGGAP